ncbi:MAG: exodeoxyribonuclease VII large subunit, partial [Clostridia bacterium]|nr:exodeoxyribonuclease VII large subunit [Clostridia bacterium]
MQAAMAAAYAKTDTLTEKLKALDPFAVLARGYAIVRNEHGEPVRSAAAVAAGDGLCLTLADGRITARAESVDLTEKEQ